MKGITLGIFLHLVFFVASAQRIDYSNYHFHKVDSIASSLKGVEGYSIQKLAASLTYSLNTDVEKIRAIYKWIAENIAYDVKEYHQYVKSRDKYSVKRRKKYLAKNSRNISKKTLRKGKAICYGYSYLFKELTASVDISSHLVCGYARNGLSIIGRKTLPDHAWNIVYLDQQWYPVDVTWSAGYTNRKVTNFEFNFNDRYFLMPPEIFIRNHYPQDPMWSMIYEPFSLRDFFNAPIVLEGYTKNKINRVYPEKGIIRSNIDTTIHFSFTSNLDKDLKQVTVKFLSLKDSEFLEDMPSIKQQLTRDENGFCFDFKFPQKGRYRLLIYIDFYPTFIYDAYVK